MISLVGAYLEILFVGILLDESRHGENVALLSRRADDAEIM